MTNCKTDGAKCAMFSNRDTLVGLPKSSIDKALIADISHHLSNLDDEVWRYFPVISSEDIDFVRNPFSPSVNVHDLPEYIQDQFVELKNNSSAKQTFTDKSISQFWCEMLGSYADITKYALKMLLPFA